MNRRANGELAIAIGGLLQCRPVNQLGQPEVRDLDDLMRRVGIDDHEVRRFQVTVNDPGIVCGLEYLTELAQKTAECPGEAALALQDLIETHAADVLHDIHASCESLRQAS